MKELLEFLIKSLVENPKKVKIEPSSEAGEEIFKITVAAEDMGRVIGKGGQIIRALRTLARTAALKYGKRVQVLLSEEATQETKN